MVTVRSCWPNQHWCDARFSQFAADFDGSTWFVARGDTLYAVDATATRWEHLWKVDERGADVRAIQRDARWASALLVRSESGGEVWTFELPSITLRRRQPLEKDHAAVAGAAVAPHGMLVGWRIGVPRLTSGSGELERDDGAVRAIVVDIDGRRKNLPVTASGPLQNLTATNEWIVLPVPDQRGTVFHLVDSKDLAVRARIALEGAEWTADIGIQGDRLIIFDGYGRVIVLSLSSGAVLREHRLA